MGKLIIALGILTYTMAAITGVSGLKGVKVQWHKALALTTISLATIHALLVISRFLS